MLAILCSETSMATMVPLTGDVTVACSRLSFAEARLACACFTVAVEVVMELAALTSEAFAPTAEA